MDKYEVPMWDLIFVAKNLDDSNEPSDETKEDYLSDTDTIIKQQII